MKAKIAIACQGGGSQTAFTAGALKALFDNKVQDYFNIVSLSGTPGMLSKKVIASFGKE